MMLDQTRNGAAQGFHGETMIHTRKKDYWIYTCE